MESLFDAAKNPARREVCFMKKELLLILLVMTVIMSVSVSYGEDMFYESFTYTILSDGTAEITGYSGEEAEITIPEQVEDEIRVTSIGSGVFANNEIITSVTIPEGVVSIGDHSFAECKALQSVSLPESLRWLGDLVFQGNIMLSEVSLPENLIRIGMNPFDRCDSLESLNISENNIYYLTEEGVLLDRKANALVAYPAGKTDPAYTIPEWVTDISAAAFSENQFITEITVHENIAAIEGNPFCGCKVLTNIVISPVNIYFEVSNNTLYNRKDKNLIAYLWNSDSESFSVPSGIRSIGNEAFYKHKELQQIKLPETLVYIGDAAFAESGLTSIKIPNSVVSLGSNTFSSCEALESVDLPSGLAQIERNAFSECSSLKDIRFPKSLNVIGEGAFYNCTSLTDLKLPEKLFVIGDYAFLFCTGLTSVDFPDHLYSIGRGAFYGIENLSVTVTPGSLAEEWAIQSQVPFEHKNVSYITTESI